MDRLRTLVGRLSLRTRLVTVLVTLLVLAIALASAATLALLRRDLVYRLDQDLVSASRPEPLGAIMDEINRERSASEAEADGRDPSPMGPGRPGRPGRRAGPALSQYHITVLSPDGSVWGQLGAFDGGSRPNVDTIHAATMARGRPGAVTVPSVSGSGQWRVMATQQMILAKGAGAPVTSPGTVIVALPMDSINETMAEMALRLSLLSVIVVGGCLAAGLVALRGAFSPLRKIEAVTAAFAAGDTSRRVPPRPQTTEVGRLGGAVNSMLDQIETTLAEREASEARMRRFVGDASHELRTPLVSVRGFAELYRQGAVRGEENIAIAFGRIEDEAKRMGGLVEDLLLLARMDEQRPLAHEPVNLSQIAIDLGRDARVLAPDRAVSLLDQERHERSAVILSGDDARLRQVATNLMMNAIRHTPSGTPIEFDVAETADGVRLRVIDHGPGIQPELAEKIFERFFRADSSRNRASGGAGLGLAIVAAIVRAHHGHVTVVETPGGGATFEVTLPKLPAPAHHGLVASSFAPPATSADSQQTSSFRGRESQGHQL